MNELGKRLKEMSEAKLELVARELQRLQGEAGRQDGPIAVLGMGCRFPGGAEDPARFWSLLESGRDVCTKAPAGRGWDPSAPPGYFLDDVERFDAALFGISPREARSMDPQQRLLLEVTWQALEDAGYAPRSMAGERVGIYVGAYADDFAHQLVWSGDVEDVDPYTSTGTSHAVAVGRLAHVFGLHGPALALDTACSSSLVAVHLACAALRAGECDLALVGGVSLALSAQTPFTLQRARMLAPDGRSKTFAARADGYGRGEGCGMVVLRRASDAQREQQRILALVRGSAVNHDGRASSLTAPNGTAQVDVIRRALAAARLGPEQVQAVECHGTGTPLGDPIEVRALREVYDGPVRAERPLRLSAVKSNVGHLEAAAGIASFIKMVLALQHEQLPGSLHVDTLNPQLSNDAGWSHVSGASEPWPALGTPRYGAVSSFGFGGTNSHVILEESPLPTRDSLPAEAGYVLALSAAQREGLQALARATREQVERTLPTLADLCLTARAGRTAHAERATIDAQGHAQLIEGLRALEQAQDHAALRCASVPSRPRCLFAFAGQGAQFAGMGQQLFERVPSFRADLLRCEEILANCADFRLTDALYGSEQRSLTSTRYAQPALFAFEYALARLWLANGVQPDAVLGHSVGEYVAAHFAGVMDLESALELVAERGRLMGALPEGGAMLAISSEPAWVETQRRRYSDFDIAALNGPLSVVIAGPASAVQRVQDHASAEGLPTVRLDVSHAFHSRLMDPVVDQLETFLQSLPLASPRLPLLSNLTGDWASADVCTPSYWGKHLRQPVRFAENLRRAHDSGLKLVLEIGPSTTLSSLARQVLGPETTVVPSLRAGRADLAMLDDASRALFLAGAEPNGSLLRELGARRCDYPSYPFGGERYRHAAAAAGEMKLRRALQGSRSHALLGENRTVAARGETLYERDLRAVDAEVAVDHRLFGRVVVPGAYYVAMALAAAARAWPGAPLRVTGAEFYAPLALEAERAQRVQTLVSPTSSRLEVSIHAAAEGSDEFTCHAKLSLSRDVEQGRASAGTATAGSELPDFYERMAEAGFELGPRFRWLCGVHCDGVQAFASARRPEGSAGVLHEQPGFVDCCFQLLAAAAHDLGLASSTELFVPVGVDSVDVHTAPPESPFLHAQLDVARSTPQMMVGDVTVTDAAGSAYLTVRGLCARRVSRSALERAEPSNQDLYRAAWQKLPAGAPQPQSYLAVGASHAEIEQLRRALGDAARVTPAARVELARLTELDQLLLFVPALGGAEGSREREAALARLLEGTRALLGVEGRRPRLRVVTRSGQLLEDRDTLDEGAYAMAGLLRTLAFEHPELRPGLIDVARGAPLGAGFVAALGIEGETVLAVHGDHCQAPRLEPHAVVAPHGRLVRTGGSYLVTGGLGGLGRVTARWLLESGAERVVLLGRRPWTPELQTELAELGSDADARVEYVAADVAVREQLTAAVRSVTRPALPWLGVVHAAGTLDDGVMLNQTSARFAGVLAPKVSGALHLLDALRAHDLDWWVFFSSVAACLGSPGQAAYAYANAFLDGLAHRLSAEGEHAVSVAWGPFADVGMAAKRFEEHALFEPLPPARLGAHVQSALASLRANVAVLRADVRALSSVYPTPRYLERLVPEAPETSQSGIHLRVDRQRVLEAEPEQRQELLLGALSHALATIVEVPADQLDPDQSLANIGLDSLTSLELKNAVEKTLGVQLSVSALLSGPTLRELATLVSSALADESVSSPVHESDEFLEHLDDRQVAALLSHLTEQETHVAS